MGASSFGIRVRMKDNGRYNDCVFPVFASA